LIDALSVVTDHLGAMPVEDPSLIRPPGDEHSAAGARMAIADIQDAFRKSDYVRIAARFHPDIDWLFHGPTSIFPEIGHRRGKVAVFQTFAALNERYRFERHVSDHLIAEGDWGSGVAEVALVQRDTGRTIRVRVASFFRVKDGLVVEYRGFTDSFDAAEQALGKVIKL
jgi:ketosteroid isomerase-like protein